MGKDCSGQKRERSTKYTKGVRSYPSTTGENCAVRRPDDRRRPSFFGVFVWLGGEGGAAHWTEEERKEQRLARKSKKELGSASTKQKSETCNIKGKG